MFGGSEAAGEKAELLGAADGTGYGGLAEEETNRRKRKTERKEREGSSSVRFRYDSSIPLVFSRFVTVLSWSSLSFS